MEALHGSVCIFLEECWIPPCGLPGSHRFFSLGPPISLLQRTRIRYLSASRATAPCRQDAPVPLLIGSCIMHGSFDAIPGNVDGTTIHLTQRVYLVRNESGEKTRPLALVYNRRARTLLLPPTSPQAKWKTFHTTLNLEYTTQGCRHGHAGIIRCKKLENGKWQPGNRSCE